MPTKGPISTFQKQSAWRSWPSDPLHQQTCLSSEDHDAGAPFLAEPNRTVPIANAVDPAAMGH
jgi:hypothetical protein